MSARIEKTLDLIYLAALEPERWPDTLAAICSISGYASGCLIVDSCLNSQPIFYATDRTERALGDFIAAGLFVSCARRLVNVGNRRFAHESEFPASSAKRPAVETLRRLGLWDQTATQHGIPEGQHFVFTFERDEDASGFSLTAVSLLNRLRPHMIRSVSIGAATKNSSGGAGPLANLRGPALLLCPDGSVAEANPEALALRPPLMDARGSHLLLPGWQDAEVIRCRLAMAAWRRAPLAVVIRPDDQQASPLSMQATPTHWRGAAMQLITFAPVAVGPQERDLARRFGLTCREAELAAMLAHGRSLAASAERLGMSRETARHHLKQIFHKTDTHRQAALVARIS